MPFAFVFLLLLWMLLIILEENMVSFLLLQLFLPFFSVLFIYLCLCESRVYVCSCYQEWNSREKIQCDGNCSQMASLHLYIYIVCEKRKKWSTTLYSERYSWINKISPKGFMTWEWNGNHIIISKNQCLMFRFFTVIKKEMYKCVSFSFSLFWFTLVFFFPSSCSFGQYKGWCTNIYIYLYVKCGIVEAPFILFHMCRHFVCSICDVFFFSSFLSFWVFRIDSSHFCCVVEHLVLMQTAIAVYLR